jgi:hypothetical protein
LIGHENDSSQKEEKEGKSEERIESYP